MSELLIIGGGFYGIAAALQAEQLGADVLIIDNERPDSGSRNAAGLVRGWGAGTTKRAPSHWRWAGPNVDWLHARGLLRHAREAVVSKVRGEWRGSWRDDLMLAEPTEILRLFRHERAHVVGLQRYKHWWLIRGSQGEEWRADKVLIAAGVWTDVLLASSNLPGVGVSPLRGRAQLINDPERDRDVVFSWAVRPYTTFTMRPWLGGLWRFGDTVERSQSGAAYAEMLMQADSLLGLQRDTAGELDGFRPVTEHYFTEEVAPGLVVSTGGHRSGLAIAGPAAERAMELFGW